MAATTTVAPRGDPMPMDGAEFIDMLILEHLATRPARSRRMPSAIAAALAQDSTLIRIACDRLEGEGLLTRFQGLRLTPEGLARLAQLTTKEGS
jgi:DNA-binding MarR family transcriptional regulator